VEKARSVMHDIAARGRYNDWLRARWSELRTRWAIENSAAQLAHDAWTRGQRALGEGDVHRAVGDFAAAARNHPGHPEYEANLAWARYRVAASRDDVDRAAVARRERESAESACMGCRPWPRAMLALSLLCAADGDPDSARWHLQEALSIDPRLPAAQQLLARPWRPALAAGPDARAKPRWCAGGPRRSAAYRQRQQLRAPSGCAVPCRVITI
jgi:hypothetical protein